MSEIEDFNYEAAADPKKAAERLGVPLEDVKGYARVRAALDKREEAAGRYTPRIAPPYENPEDTPF